MTKLKLPTTARFLKSCLIFLLPAVIFCGCGEQIQTKQRKCYLVVKNGSGWSSGSSVVECDSFQMQGTRKAFAWVDGYKMNVEAEDVIYPAIR